MKLVQINCVYGNGSTGRTTMEMHEYCRNSGIESHVFCTNISNEEQNIYRVGSNCDHKIHALCSRIFGKQAFFSKNATKKMLEKLGNIYPDVVILRNLHSNYVHLPLLLKYLSKNNIPTIAVMHDCWFFTGHCTHYFSDNCYKWQTECKKCAQMKKDNKSLFFDTSNFMFKHKKSLFDTIPRLGVIGVSDWITNEAKQSVILSNAKIFHRVYNWIDLKKFYPRNTLRLKEKLGIDNQFVVLGVASSWDKRKGLNHFVSLATKHNDIIVILVGDVVEEIPNLKNLKSVGRTSNVDELAEYYSLASVLLVCSPQETFGKVSAEALACGTPIISNDRTANPEIAGADCGIVIHNNDEIEISDAIKTMQSKGKSFYQENCILRAKNNFNSEEQIKKYIKVAENLISL